MHNWPIRNTTEYHILSEEYHITKTYIPVIKEILYLYEEYKDNNNNILIYTKYNLNIDTQIVSYQNNESIDIPIYVKFIYTDNTETFAALEERDDHPDTMIIQLNVNLIKHDETSLAPSLQHEFLHAREMYASPDINALNSHKNKIPNNEPNVFKHLVKPDFNIIMKICYLFNKSEERARLNGTYTYVKNNKSNINKNLATSYIKQLLIMSLDVSLLKDMQGYLDKVELRTNNLLFFEALLYYMNKFGLSKSKLKLYHFNNTEIEVNRYYNTDKTATKLINKVYDILESNYNDFYKNIQNIIYKAYNE